jgi:hypothetical protein
MDNGLRFSGFFECPASDFINKMRPLHGVMSGTRIRQKFVKKRSLHGVNEHFSQIFNAIIAPRSSRAKVSR